MATFAPDGVTGQYWEYSKWRAAHRVFSAIMGTMATQAMLTAIGVGSSTAIPAAAALNWVLKDGLGKVGKLGVTAAFGRSFDSDLKRFRYAAAIIMVACETVEMVTPLFPGSFLLLASLSSCGKAVALSTALAVQPAIHKTFSTVDNMAEITAKSQAQHVIVDNTGLALAVFLTKLMYRRNASWARVGGLNGPILLFPLLIACELACTHKELEAVQLRTLNRERAELAVAEWVATGAVGGPAAVSQREGLLVPPWLLHPECQPRLELLPVSRLAAGPEDLEDLVSGRERGAMHALRARGRGLGRAGRGRVEGLGVAMEHGAGGREYLAALLHAAYLRAQLPRGKDGRLAPVTTAQARVLEREAGRAAAASVGRLEESLRRSGWDTSKVYLSSRERVSFVLS